MEPSIQAKLRVLLVDHTGALGGAELALLRLVQNLDPSRFEPVVLLFEKGPMIEMLRECGAEVHCIHLRPEINCAPRAEVRWTGLFRSREIISILSHIRLVTRFIRSHRVDLVHTNSLKATVIGGVAATLARKPFVWYVHNRIASDYLPAFAVKALHLFAILLPTVVVGNSFSTLQSFGPKLPRRRGVVYPGVDMEVFRQNEKAEEATSGKPKEVRIGIIGRISPTKGQEVFIRAASVVAGRHPEASFFIIGSAMFNDAPWEIAIRRQASETVDTQIEFTGFCSDVAAEMAKLDIVVHASTVPEAFGQVVAEAMACGKPVVATASGGVPEMVTDGRCGWLVPKGDAEQMADRIIWLIEHPEEAKTMGQLGRQKVASHFTVQKMARDMESFYDQAMSFVTGPMHEASSKGDGFGPSNFQEARAEVATARTISDLH